MNSLFERRLDRLRAAIRGADLDAVALVPGATFHFLTGVRFHLMERPTVLFAAADGALHAIIPVLERGRWAAAMPDVETVYWQDSDGFAAAFETLARRFRPGRLGVEGQRIRFFEAEAMRRGFGNTLVVDAQDAIASIRLHKDEAEVAAMRRAIDISERAWLATLREIGAGMSEAAVRRALVGAMLAEGAEGVAFDPIVLTGAASADPHGTASEERVLARGDALLFDFGAAWAGYNADITRTVFVETVADEHARIYEAVAAANALGRALPAPGVTLDSVDHRVTQTLRDSGFAELIVHKTGHGLGLDVHEAPQVMIGNHQALEPGMIITIEPGLYRDGEIGVRIEDDVLITPDGAESLTGLDRSLRLVG
jgi:Xaa-Pro aminopeptidase